MAQNVFMSKDIITLSQRKWFSGSVLGGSALWMRIAQVAPGRYPEEDGSGLRPHYDLLELAADTAPGEFR
jgi:hypothetical protein